MSDMKPLSQNAIAKELGVSSACMVKWKKQGCPTDSVESVRAWRKAKQNIAARKPEPVADFEELGILRFQTGEIKGRGRPEKFAMLNEDQCYLLLTYSRNTARTRQLKVRLVKAFGEARRAAVQHGAEYLPTYRQLHDELHALAAGSEHERHVHMNVNRLINKTVGLEAGHRESVALPQQSMLAVAQIVAANAAKGAPDHRAGYQRIKTAMRVLSAATMLGVSA